MAATQPTTNTTRLAPSPTGALHLGNALTFMVNWALARKLGWRVVLRVEDLDGPRIKQGADRLAVELLEWLGMDWDDGPVYQSADLSPYQTALELLRRQGDIYPCDATRKQIEAALSAPNEGDHELRYPPPEDWARLGLGQAERGAGAPSTESDHPNAPPLLADDRYAWRLRVPDEAIAFTDALHGAQEINVQQHVGDFVVATKAGLPAYQLAVVVDDARQGVTQVMRGDDLLSSTARQVLLYHRLGLSDQIPSYTHLPMVYGEDGRRLAKRHGDTRLVRYMSDGVPVERVIGLLGYWAGLQSDREPMTSLEFVRAIEIDGLSKDPITFTSDDDAWLVKASG